MGNVNLPHPYETTAEALAFDAFAQRERELLEQLEELADVESDNRWLKEMLKEAIDMLHKTNVQLDRSKATIGRLCQELRDLRGELARAA